jgi:hypothetical protein
LLGEGRFVAAEQRAAAFLARHPGNASALACHAMAHWKAGRDIALALDETRRALAVEPKNPAIWHNLATLQASDGDIAGAAASFEQALALKPDDTRAFYGLAQNRRFTGETPLLGAMERLNGRADLGAEAREFLCFGLAKAFDDLGQHEKAMRYCLEANRLASRQWDADFEAQSFDELARLAAADAFRKLPRGGNTTEAPIFIVGMNRSGTTLVETILSRHPAVFAGDEMPDVPAVEAEALARLRGAGFRGGRNAALKHLPADWLDRQGGKILAGIGARAGGPVTRFTDKLPENAVRLGLIARLFPQARIVHVRRHPLDCGVSNLFMRFTQGQGFAFRQDWIGARTRQLAETMALWKQALDLEVLDVSYENLVADPEAETRRLVAFTGLDWHPACLAPERAERSVRTASQWQVRQPVYRGAVGRWRAYEPWLGPMIAAMGGMAWIEAEFAASRGAG